ncbi:trifunctional serine/threonine-protein kinase/ATP-binding protein/sensor histidine kinase [Archangium violaceum]|uniref:trifunctional serine/threonine-protein kinase/ATP-binding protein/sensor histidine kinase n=1 Tax=Archangium violaceum TaxID=83451 RepID=UPI001EF043DD|nr:AAA family ATPase [Archangium violaceum]
MSGYSAVERIFESSRSIIERARRNADGTPVIIKRLNAEFPSADDLARLRREYRVGREVAMDGVIEFLALERYHNGLAIVMEDSGGESLAHSHRGRAMELRPFLQLAIQLAETLGRIHRRRVIHKDINPSNIIWNSRTGSVRLIDFGIASELSRESTTILGTKDLEGTLPYISPEQTGRMNRATDYRTDFYSLGVTFYELLTGRRPFTSSDPMELVHCHIARPPRPPHELEPSLLPEVISEIIQKLMAKRAEDRYQSAFALQADLKRCLASLESEGRIVPFPIAERNFSDSFQLPQKLYGRERELQALLDAFDRVATGASELMLVSGYSGIGKSALVHEVHKPIVAKRGYFVSGKFDQYNRKIPYASLIQAFRALIRQLLTESPEQLAGWKQKLLDALGPNIQVLIEVIHELELIVGRQPPVPELPPKEAQNRFNLAFEKLFGVFCGEAHPVVMFLDDLQWADLPSLRLLEVLTTTSEVHHLLVIGAYRDNEVEGAHPLTQAVEELHRRGARVGSISLSSLAPEQCLEFLADTLHRSPADVQPVAELCLRHTGGNPFFMSQYLLALHEQGVFEFDTHHGYWRWELARLAQAPITDDVVELMAGKIQRLLPETQRELQLAACIGNKFDLQTLSVVSTVSVAEAVAALWPALREGLLVPEGNSYKFAEDLAATLALLSPEAMAPASHQGEDVVLRFLHDRVQQAAYSLIPETERPALHLRIGRLLRDSVRPEERDERVFEIVNHLNAGLGLITDPAEHEVVAELNLTAARKANASAARVAALSYCRTGLELLGEHRWTRRYELALALHLQAAEAAYLGSDFAETERHVLAVDRHARELLEKVKAHELQIEALIAQTRLWEAVHTALNLVKELTGIEFPENPGPADVGAYLAEAQAALGGRPIASLIDLPPMKDARTLAAVRILVKVTSASYLGAPALFPLISLRLTVLGLTKGHDGSVAFAYSLYGLLLNALLGDVDSGHEFGQLALRMLERYDAREFETRTRATVGAFLTHWKTPLQEAMVAFKENYQSGLEAGDVEYALYSAQYVGLYAFTLGTHLTELEQLLTRYVETMERFKQVTVLRYVQTNLAAVRSMKSDSAEPWRMVHEGYDFERMMEFHREAKDASGIGWGHTHKLMVCSYFGRTAEALKALEVAEQHQNSMLGTHYVDMVNFHGALTRLAACERASPRERAQLLEKVEASQQKRASWVTHAPMNRAHTYAIVEAEQARVLGDREKARAAYYRAISLCQQHNYPNHQALASELFARFLLKGGEEEFGNLFIAKARHLYSLWGASAKVRQLEAQYPTLSQSHEPLRKPQGLVTTTRPSSGSLDFLSVLKASQAISGEMVLPELLKKIMSLVIENAGARRGLMLLPGERPLLVELDDTHREDHRVVIQHAPLRERSDISMAMVRYVERTREAVVLGDASSDRGAFQTDPYLSLRKSRSILCLPILHHSKLVGILYLENDLLANAFTPERCRVLELLSAQAAISLENARLYETLDNRVIERTQELSKALEDLRNTQRKLVVQEKLASLGMLTSGIAHEIKNPLNFINNFAELSIEGMEELNARLKQEASRLGADARDEVEDLLAMLRQNTKKIHQYGRRADAIVNSMLQHARGTAGPLEQTDLNKLVSESLQLAHDSFRLQNTGFQVVIDERYAPTLPPVPLSSQRMGRVITNLVNNALYALQKRSQQLAGAFTPTLRLSTREREDRIELRIWDNGGGIPEAVRDKVFAPFFTTKPPGEGTGLGLSLSYDIVSNVHGGTLEFENHETGTEFVVTLPKHQTPRREESARAWSSTS